MILAGYEEDVSQDGVVVYKNKSYRYVAKINNGKSPGRVQRWKGAKRREGLVLRKEVANYLGLPAEQGIRGGLLGFDAYMMRPLPGQSPTVFGSKVAPIKHGAYSSDGGGEQILVPVRNKWTDPNKNKIGEIRGPGVK